MMRGQDQGGYDRGLTVFSPQGRLFQVEYAIEAVKRGTLAIAIKGTDGAVIAVHKKISIKLMDHTQINKIFMVDKHVGAAISGLHADARILIDQARVQSAVYRLTYDEDAPVAMLVKKISDLKQAYSQHAGVRPFGAALLFVGIDDDGPQLHITSPSGMSSSWIAKTMGNKSDEAQEYLKDEYTELRPVDEVKKLALATLMKFVDDEITVDTLQIGVVEEKEREFKILAEKERAALIEAAKKELDA